MITQFAEFFFGHSAIVETSNFDDEFCDHIAPRVVGLNISPL
jgi:hypothetical protein